MLGELITKSLVLILGYAYPAFECFKTIERHGAANSELRFWCQYWVIIAILTVVERIGDIFISWVPMYGELKLALIIYLWYPKTKGTGYVYNAMLRPFVARHETDIEKSLREMRRKVCDVAIYYWHNSSNWDKLHFMKYFDIWLQNLQDRDPKYHFSPSRFQRNPLSKKQRRYGDTVFNDA
ncbi:putative HVA22-like protein g [Rutidosis leptorrhynchoides]|uniref:putative HVA22-like protein g n=1 Tax=Rutidosis leptorrhynchoides TaxID=125765 RepID=UPI003A990B75